MNVVTFRAMAHRQDVVGKVGSFVPGGCQRDVATDQIRVSQHFDPREAVGVGPYRVVDAREINIELRRGRLSRDAATETTSHSSIEGYSRGQVVSFHIFGCGGV